MIKLAELEEDLNQFNMKSFHKIAVSFEESERKGYYFTSTSPMLKIPSYKFNFSTKDIITNEEFFMTCCETNILEYYDSMKLFCSRLDIEFNLHYEIVRFCSAPMEDFKKSLNQLDDYLTGKEPLMLSFFKNMQEVKERKDKIIQNFPKTMKTFLSDVYPDELEKINDYHDKIDEINKRLQGRNYIKLNFEMSFDSRRKYNYDFRSV